MMLDKQELQYLLDQDFLRKKQLISQKLIQRLADLQIVLRDFLANSAFAFPETIDLRTGKISRGERYQDLPYYILDFPRLIQRDDVFSLRTMCWWGHEFSCTLHLQGKSKEKYQAILFENRDLLRARSLYFCLGDSPWEYHFEQDNYELADKLSDAKLRQLIEKKEFIKISRRLEISRYAQLADFVLESLQNYLLLLDKRSL